MVLRLGFVILTLLHAATSSAFVALEWPQSVCHGPTTTGDCLTEGFVRLALDLGLGLKQYCVESSFHAIWDLSELDIPGTYDGYDAFTPPLTITPREILSDVCEFTSAAAVIQ